ncbi:hypothetical protein [Maritimibacter sp. DP1N21-5]|uniref:hypothetical protein n=1 Tax=Maritimibacter sp. DP1N21-5 TaxID=2836867 RepID=UPI001C46FCED|nr:hypothetical protein [Maritimibacter sp. DP1N21-5]MBV7407610.1 hypothetical protein [Maritimibacter sp. DP1N21-5]
MFGTTIFSSDNLRATLFGGGGRDVIFTFDHWRCDRAGFVQAAPARGFVDAGFDHIRIQSAHNDWFLNPDLPALLDAVEGASGPYRTRRGVGYSMGGYGLLILSRAISLDQALFLSPHTTPLPDLPSRHPLGDLRYLSGQADADFLRHAHGIIRDSGRRRGEVAVLYDPLVPGDQAQAREVKRLFVAPRMMALGGAGHPVTGRLSKEMAVRLVHGAITGPHLCENTVSRAIVRAIRLGARKKLWSASPPLRAPTGLQISVNGQAT